VKITRNELKYNETTNESYTEICLKKDDNVLLECVRCRTILRFKAFSGDSFYLKVFPCEKCLENATVKASLKLAKEIIEREII